MTDPAASNGDTQADAMRAALRRARQREAAHFDAAQDIRDAQTLRLFALKSELAPLIAAHPEAQENIDLVLQTGERPRLWIDLTSYVVMEPDPRTYRLMEDHRDGRTIIAETGDLAAFINQLTDFIAHRVIVRQRSLSEAPAAPPAAGFSTAALILAWLSGFALGVLALLAIAAAMSKPPF